MAAILLHSIFTLQLTGTVQSAGAAQSALSSITSFQGPPQPVETVIVYRLGRLCQPRSGLLSNHLLPAGYAGDAIGNLCHAGVLSIP